MTTQASPSPARLWRWWKLGDNIIETESFQINFQCPFSEINLASEELGNTYADHNAKLYDIIGDIAKGLPISLMGNDFDAETGRATLNMSLAPHVLDSDCQRNARIRFTGGRRK